MSNWYKLTRLLEHMQDQKFHQDDIASITNIPVDRILELADGASMADPEEASAIAEVLGLQIKDLIERNDYYPGEVGGRIVGTRPIEDIEVQDDFEEEAEAFLDSDTRNKIHGVRVPSLGILIEQKDTDVESLARDIDIEVPLMQRIVAGTEIPNAKLALRIADALNVSVFELSSFPNPETDPKMAEFRVTPREDLSSIHSFVGDYMKKNGHEEELNLRDEIREMIEDVHTNILENFQDLAQTNDRAIRLSAKAVEINDEYAKVFECISNQIDTLIKIFAELQDDVHLLKLKAEKDKSFWQKLFGR